MQGAATQLDMPACCIQPARRARTHIYVWCMRAGHMCARPKQEHPNAVALADAGLFKHVPKVGMLQLEGKGAGRRAVRGLSHSAAANMARRMHCHAPCRPRFAVPHTERLPPTPYAPHTRSFHRAVQRHAFRPHPRCASRTACMASAKRHEPRPKAAMPCHRAARMCAQRPAARGSGRERCHVVSSAPLRSAQKASAGAIGHACSLSRSTLMGPLKMSMNSSSVGASCRTSACMHASMPLQAVQRRSTAARSRHICMLSWQRALNWDWDPYHIPMPYGGRWLPRSTQAPQRRVCVESEGVDGGGGHTRRPACHVPQQADQRCAGAAAAARLRPVPRPPPHLCGAERQQRF